MGGECLLRDFLHPGCVQHVFFYVLQLQEKGVMSRPLKFSGNALL